MKKKVLSERKNLRVTLKKGVNKNKLVRGILIAGVVLLLVLLFLLLMNYGVFDTPREEKIIQIKDECSLVMGNIIHNIKDSGDCQIRCRNECSIREMDFNNISFNAKNSSCHACDCYCK